MPETKNPKYECCNCGHVQIIETAKGKEVVEYCHGCSWQPTFGQGEAIKVGQCDAYRRFKYVGQ